MQKQLMIEFPLPRIHGGARKGSGRKRQGKRAKVTHMARHPFGKTRGKTRVLHVTSRVQGALHGLRDHETAGLVMDYLAGHREKKGFRVVEYSIQGNHAHLVCEATANEAPSAHSRWTL